MANLSDAIIEARKRHEAEIAERLKRRQQRQKAEVEKLNLAATGNPPPAEPPPLAEPQRPVVAEPPPLPEPPPPPPPPPAVPVSAPPREIPYELETPPDGRFLKLRNDIIDRVKPYLTGNQFAVYLEIYRQTIGRGRTSAWFRTREIQTACNLGSDNTVRDAYPVLEAKRLIKLDPNRRAGSPRGLYITVLSVERALDRLERTPASSYSTTSVDTVPASNAPTSSLAAPATQPASPASDEVVSGDTASLLEALKRKYGVSPTMAPTMLDLVAANDRELLPYLFRRLDRSVATGKVHNPAGLLRVWLESFETWRPELAAERDADLESRRVAAVALSRDELMLEWFREVEEQVAERFAALDDDTLEATRLRGRREMLTRSASVRTWNEQQWEAQLEIYVKSEIRRELGTFEEWLAERESR